VLAQTEGEDTPIPPIPGFDIDTALCALNITRTPFDELKRQHSGLRPRPRNRGESACWALA